MEYHHPSLPPLTPHLPVPPVTPPLLYPLPVITPSAVKRQYITESVILLYISFTLPPHHPPYTPNHPLVTPITSPMQNFKQTSKDMNLILL